MKKFIYTFTLFSLFVLTISPAIAGVNPDTTSVDTGLTRDTSGGAAPIVKAKWEANIDYRTEDSTEPGAQFMPSSQYNIHREIGLCAIVTDENGLDDIDNVYADVFYPEGIALGDSHVALADQSGLGCGGLMQEDTLGRLSKIEGYELFCGPYFAGDLDTSVRAHNNNLPTFNAGYDYEEICKADGELMKETAAVYCGTKEISYEDPSGIYEVWAVAQDGNGLQDILKNHFEYLPLTAFETDFSMVAYDNVRLNTHKIISGDLTWDALDMGGASVRNVGNTRLAMGVWQDDMGLDKTDGIWNVKYDARVGSFAPFSVYWPEETTILDDELDLSELDEMDFSVLISKFPPTHESDSFVGDMVLNAVARDHLFCDNPGPQVETRNISLENKEEGSWQVISDDNTFGDIEYSHNDNTFHGLVTGEGLVPGGYYQITFNSQPECPSFTSDSFANAGANAFASGYWNTGPDLDPTCVPGGEGVFNIDLIGDHYTFQADGVGAFSHSFDLNLSAGDYANVKVLVKKMLDTHVSPWSDTGPGYPAFNLYETATINFTVLP